MQSQVGGRKITINAPEVVQNYNRGMDGVDHHDQYRSSWSLCAALILRKYYVKLYSLLNYKRRMWHDDPSCATLVHSGTNVPITDYSWILGDGEQMACMALEDGKRDRQTMQMLLGRGCLNESSSGAKENNRT